ncbi:MAG TPA: hypothetical protein ENI20_15015 [Bacteroides sp.]|nr:hypothetical protein [Bacteroides sp.]
MKNLKNISGIILILCTPFAACGQKKKITDTGEKDDITVTSYYFPNYHEDKRNASYHGNGWTEWELVKEAKPRFENHHQPKVPAWGYTDEADPVQMAQKIDAAADHGIDAFIFAWYMYEDGPFLDRCIDEGFLKAENCERLDFAFLWANHDWVDIHPYTKGDELKCIYPAKVSPERFEEICDILVEKYFTQPNYLKIDGKAYFSVYDIPKFVEGFGSMEATKAAMDRLREKAKAAGLEGVHWNMIDWQPKPNFPNAPSSTAELIKIMGFNSSTAYHWMHYVELTETKTDYNYVHDAYLEHYTSAVAEYKVPYYPTVVMGWDVTPRCDLASEWEAVSNPILTNLGSKNVGYPYMNTIGNNTPDNFKAALQKTKEKLLSNPNGPRILNINCWNEWTEGSYLEPDIVNGMKYLEAVKDVFGGSF